MSSVIGEPLSAVKLGDEEGRFLALAHYEVLDTPSEPGFERIVELVKQSLDVPICAVSLIDRDRQWFKARCGLDAAQTPRDISFCTHAIGGAGPFVVEDATLDDRFRANPLVVGPPRIRAYAGVPLRTPDGYQVGTLCAIDTAPRAFPPQEIDRLTSFARLVVDQLEMRQSAGTDRLTGARSRREFLVRAGAALRHCLEAGEGIPAALALLDVDHLTAINETHGHHAADRLLERLGALARSRLRPGALLGRIGGEELAWLLPACSDAEALAAAERLRERFAAEPVELHGDVRVAVTVSIGIAMGEPGDTLTALMERAAQALVCAKASGRNQCVLAARSAHMEASPEST